MLWSWSWLELAGPGGLAWERAPCTLRFPNLVVLGETRSLVGLFKVIFSLAAWSPTTQVTRETNRIGHSRLLDYFPIHLLQYDRPQYDERFFSIYFLRQNLFGYGFVQRVSCWNISQLCCEAGALLCFLNAPPNEDESVLQDKPELTTVPSQRQYEVKWFFVKDGSL